MVFGMGHSVLLHSAVLVYNRLTMEPLESAMLSLYIKKHRPDWLTNNAVSNLEVCNITQDRKKYLNCKYRCGRR